MAHSWNVQQATLSRGGALDMADYSNDAIRYFDSVRTPSAFILGSALAALFSLSKDARELRKQKPIQRVALLLYHLTAMISLVLSFNVVITATATSTYLLLDCNNRMARSVVDFLKRECYYELLITRWSFLTGLFSFLACIGLRVLIEFDLLRMKRIRSAIFVVCSLSSLVFHLLAIVNRRIMGWPNLGAMTGELIRLSIQRCASEISITEGISILFLVISIGSALSLIYRAWSMSFDLLDDNEASIQTPRTKEKAQKLHNR